MSVLKALKYSALIAVTLILTGVFSYTAHAQLEGEPGDVTSGVAQSSSKSNKDALLDPNLYLGLQEAYQRNLKLRTPDARPGEWKTLLYTLWQHRLLQEFRQEGIRNRGVASNENLDTPTQKVRGIRELSLGGILYSSAEKWIVWLNGQRVTPDAIPRQVLDIRVNEEYVELKWSDSFSNLIFPIRLRPHQRFNLDSRMFLPGTPPL